MFEAIRLAVSTATGGFAGWFGYIVFIGVRDFGVRCSGSFNAEEHLSFTVLGAIAGCFSELARRGWRKGPPNT